MTSEGTAKKPIPNDLILTNRVIDHLKRLSPSVEAGKKPTVKVFRKAKKLLSVLEAGHMPWPSIAATRNGGLMFTWTSLTRDVLLIIDSVGDMQFTTSLKKINIDTCEVIERLDSEGSITDMLVIDHMMAWYSQDQAFRC